MVKIYYDLIHAGLRTIEKVPVRWRAEVQALLDADEA
ncbi:MULTISPECIES: CD1375 family protein [Peribacillus]|nr:MULTISPECIES: CD1375 family protein [unclassified Peribacillus]